MGHARQVGDLSAAFRGPVETTASARGLRRLQGGRRKSRCLIMERRRSPDHMTAGNLTVYGLAVAVVVAGVSVDVVLVGVVPEGVAGSGVGDSDGVAPGFGVTAALDFASWLG